MGFVELAELWHKETALHSSISIICEHWAYQEIIKMGMPVVPLILKDMETTHGHWFHALTKITGENPIPGEHAGHVNSMVEDWLALGRERGWI